jgi:hypothetical protein
MFDQIYRKSMVDRTMMKTNGIDVSSHTRSRCCELAVAAKGFSLVDVSKSRLCKEVLVQPICLLAMKS